MTAVTIIIIGLGIVFIAFLIYKQIQKHDREKKEIIERQNEASRKDLVELYSKLYPQILNAYKTFQKHSDINTGYFSNYQLST